MAAIVLGTLLAAWLVALAVVGLALRRDLREFEGLTELAPDQIDFNAAAALVRTTRRDTTALRLVAGPALWLAPAFGWVPHYGGDLAAAPALLDLAAGLTQAADEALVAFRPLLDELESPSSEADIAQLLADTLPAAEPHLQIAAEAMERATAARGRIDTGTLTPGLAAKLARLDRYLPLLQSGLSLAQSLPTLLGMQNPQTYLLLAQNQDERRATGGFISGAGLLTLDHGRITELRLADAYAVDNPAYAGYPAPPADFTRYVGGNVWVLRDANWSPDFPTSAQAAEVLYDLGQQRAVDGVIAFDQTAVQMALSAIGPVTVPGTPEPVGAENVIAYMRAAWSASPQEGVTERWYQGRKDFMGTLARAMLDQLLAARDPATAAALARALIASLNERHILIYAHDAPLARTLAEAGWDGHVDPGTNDFLMVVDTNLGFNKVNPAIQESLDYRVDLSDPHRPTATLTVHYTHTATASVPCRHAPDYGSGQYAELMQRCYWDYWRMLVPRGATLLSGPVNQVPADELITGVADLDPTRVTAAAAGTTQLAGFFVLPPGEAQALQFLYALSATVLDQSAPGSPRYRLHVQKQPGTGSLPLTLTLTYPPQWRVTDSTPAAGQSVAGQLSYALTLQTDLNLQVSFQTD